MRPAFCAGREQQRAPRGVEGAESPYDPNDPKSVRAFWAKAKVRYPGQRGPQKAPTKT
jgi:hypothetical protein